MKPKKILVVDNDLASQNFLINVLESENLNVVTLKDDDKALKFALEEKPDIIVVDIGSSTLNGLRLIAKIRHNLATRYIPIIALSGTEAGDVDVQGLEAGADQYLSKPVNSRKLLAVLNRLFSRTSD